ncbi:hypothetical protein [Spiroplasma endosymbiont of Aspidapion aeneum]|uniref:hypothetical protein n=1 Tax=Spiroplasma endosymbiont of Aspidapion aeneum TaxID=3066276 RepID=UPI00313F048F
MLNKNKVENQNKKSEFLIEFKDYLDSIGKNIVMLFASSFKSLRTYLIAFLIPIGFLLMLMLYQTHSGLNQIRIAQLIGYSLIPCFFVIFLINLTIAEWKSSVFLKRIHTSGVSKRNFFISSIIFGLITGILMYCVGLFFIYIIGIVFIRDPLDSSINLSYAWRLLSFESWLSIIFGMILTNLVSILCGIIFSGICKSVSLSQSISILFVAYAIVFSDNFLNPMTIAVSKNLVLFSYLNPFKHTVWTSYLLGCRYNGVFIKNWIFDGSTNRLEMSFGLKPYIPPLTSILYIALLSFLGLYSFKWNNR